jgi:serine/threonine protein kinase
LLKINLLTDIEIKNVKNEIHIMKMFDHWNIIKFYDTFQDEKNIYICME